MRSGSRSRTACRFSPLALLRCTYTSNCFPRPSPPKVKAPIITSGEVFGLLLGRPCCCGFEAAEPNTQQHMLGCTYTAQQRPQEQGPISPLKTPSLIFFFHFCWVFGSWRQQQFLRGCTYSCGCCWHAARGSAGLLCAAEVNFNDFLFILIFVFVFLFKFNKARP